MAKSKNNKKENIFIDILGLVIIVLSIMLLLDIGGVFSHLLNTGIFFLFGRGFYAVYIFGIYVGLALIFQRGFLKLDKVRLAGLSLMIFSLAAIFSVVISEDISFFKAFDQLVEGVSSYWDTSKTSMSGGIFGVILASLLVTVFSYTGAYIILVMLFIIGLILLTGKTFVQLLKEGRDSSVKVASKTFSKPNFFDYEKVVDTDKLEVSEVETKPKKRELKKPQIVQEKVEEVEDIQELSVNSVSLNENYQLPPLYLLNRSEKKQHRENFSGISDILVRTLKDFSINATVVNINQGPTVTQFELELEAGTKLSKVRNLSSELALGLAAKDVRIQAPIPGKSTVGIEIANRHPQLVGLREIISTIEPSQDKTTFALGRDIRGNAISYSLSKMPHLLVAGATGSGKSVCINSIIVSILMRAKPDEVKLLLIDPKKVELSGYNGIPHLLSPVISDPRKASIALKKIIDEMEERYEKFSDTNVKNIDSYNQKMLDSEQKELLLPYIVVVVDELADLMLVASKEVEDSIMRITQMARAAGINLIVATQRPSTDVITGVIKANIPSRISFSVSSSIDSRTILDSTGAEKLLGRGDMLIQVAGEIAPTRVQGAFLSDGEVEKVVSYTTKQQAAIYDEKLVQLEVEQKGIQVSEDDLYDEVLEFVLEVRKASASLLQRRFRIGYNRASRLIDELEHNGVIGPAQGSKPREILIEE